MGDEKWEYALDGFDLRDFNCADIEASMQRRGDDGWELVSYAAINEGMGYTRSIHVAWRRRLSSAPASSASADAEATR